VSDPIICIIIYIFTVQPCFPVVGEGPSTLIPDPPFFCYPQLDLQIILFTVSPFSSNVIPFVRFSGVDKRCPSFMSRSTSVSHPDAPPSSDLFNYLYYRCLYFYPDICFSIPISDVPCAATSLLFAWLAVCMSIVPRHVSLFEIRKDCTTDY